MAGYFFLYSTKERKNHSKMGKLKMPVAPKNLLPCGAIFAVQQTDFCCTADELLLGSRFLWDAQ